MPTIADSRATLVVVPCSASKAPDGTFGTVQGPSVVDQLPAALAAELTAARQRNARGVRRGAALMPALSRYTGALYEAARPALGALLSSGMNVLVLSGGYGVVRADELIADYDMRFSPRMWPAGIVERSLAAYAAGTGCTILRAFAGTTTPYAHVIRRTVWGRAGVRDAVLISPEFHGSGAMRAVPVAIGAALVAFAQDRLTPEWRSRAGIGFKWEHLP